MTLKDLILQKRSCRRFYEKETISLDTLKDCIDLARLTASSGNLQPLKYIVSVRKEINDIIFPHLAWAGYLTDWDGPQSGERPPSYIIVLADKNIHFPIDCDHGISAQTITLAATEKGLSTCILSAIDRRNLRQALNIDNRYEILLVIAIGRCREKRILEEVKNDGSIEYWRDEQGQHHVPKRSLNEIIVHAYY